MRTLLIIVSFVCFISCNTDRKASITVRKWYNKEIIFPKNFLINNYGYDTTKKKVSKTSKYKILTYIDTTGCTPCKLKLIEWKYFISILDSLSKCNISYILVFNNNDPEYINGFLKKEKFNRSVIIDRYDTINTLNHFPTEIDFQTFLLDSTNKVILIGNPIHNPKLFDMYISIFSKL